ncbi:MAG: MCE family protein [Acidobacteria bacterium]|jgi:phospholipid/cholesterol/gamma-HCH transport system substrate-binding protein|nr:MAG: MCE family protein [Acidobacteriota bacterium]GIU82240.1 MAG: ABC transporter substrate-binding protein [Pyrinomonadaceae bacterium]
MPTTQRYLGLSGLRVGIFVFLTLLALAFLIINSSGDFNPFEKRMRLRARFVSADGLRPGAEVQLAGILIGRVEDVRFLPPDDTSEAKVEAVMSVSSEIDGRPITERIRTDSTAQLVATSVLANDKMINITPGTAKGEPVSENHILESTAAISINQLTQTGNDLLNQINKLAIPVNEILNKANRGEGTIGRIINDESLYRNLDQTINEAKTTMIKLQTTLDNLNSGRGSAGRFLNDPTLYENLNKTVSQLEAISAELRQGRGTAGKLISDDSLYNEANEAIKEIRIAAHRLNTVAENLDKILQDLNQGKGTAGKLLKDEALYNDLKNSVATINSLLSDIKAGKGTVGKLFTDETLYENLNQTTANISQFSTESTRLLNDFRQNPKKYLTIKLKIF